MVNQLHTIKDRVVKAEKADAKLPRVTAKGGLAAAQALARRQGLWNIVKACFPARKDATQGFQTEVCVSSLVFGLLSGGKGFSARRSRCAGTIRCCARWGRTPRPHALLTSPG